MYYDYKVSQEIDSKQYPFYALLMALIRQADSENTRKIRLMWPEVWQELYDRYNAPGGKLPSDEE